MLVPIRRSLASVAAWVLGAATAVAVGLLALSMIGDGLVTGTVRSTTSDQDDSAQVVAPAPSPSLTPGSSLLSPNGPMAVAPHPVATTGTPSPSSSAGTRLFSTGGGTALARCTPGGAYLISWSPAQDYSVGDVQRGPATTVDVRFIDGSRESVIAVRCENGMPQSVGWQQSDHTGGQ